MKACIKNNPNALAPKGEMDDPAGVCLYPAVLNLVSRSIAAMQMLQDLLTDTAGALLACVARHVGWDALFFLTIELVLGVKCCLAARFRHSPVNLPSS